MATLAHHRTGHRGPPGGRPGQPPRCRRCLRCELDGTGFRLQTPENVQTRCLTCALRHPPLVRRSALAALVVGSVLTAINHVDVLATGAWGPALLWKVPLTYAVPFVVATWGALANSRGPR